MPPSPRGHVRTPTDLLYAEGISEGATRLWQVLDDLCREQPAAWATVGQVAAAVARDRDKPPTTRSVARWRAELVDAGWLAHEPARNRGEVSWWQPLRRARPVDNSARRVTGRVTRLSTSDLGKGDSGVSLDAPATRARTQEKNPSRGGVIDLRAVDDERHRVAALAGRPSSWPAWCGSCEPRTSQAESLLNPGAAMRCTACHPSRPAPAF